MRLISAHLCVVIILLSCVTFSNSFLYWFFPSLGRVENEVARIQPLGLPHVKSNEEKFLDEAKKHIKISPLDMCQHKIILKLKSSCSQLSEEALLKISVNLLNCQSEVEGRKTVPCTEEMTLKECTMAMDTRTWNLYHMMSIRAKSVCYLKRQEQFNAYSDMMLSRLTRVSRDQLATMNSLEEGQDKLQVMARETLNFVLNAQEQLKMRDAKFSAYKKKLEDAIGANIIAINEQDDLISDAQEELAVFIEDIENAFDAANMDVTQLQKLQLDVMSMLHLFKNKSGGVWNKFDNISSESNISIEKLKMQVGELVRVVTAVSDVLKSVIMTVEDVISKVLFVLSVLFCLPCSAEEQDAKVWCYIQHAMLIVGSLSLWIFLHLEFQTFLLVIHCNFITYLWRLKHSLKHSELTMEIFLLITGQWLLLKLCKFLVSRKKFFKSTARKFVNTVQWLKNVIRNSVGAARNWIVSRYTRTRQRKEQLGHQTHVLRGLSVPRSEQPSRTQRSSRTPTPSHRPSPSSRFPVRQHPSTPLSAPADFSTFSTRVPSSHVPSSHVPSSHVPSSHVPNRNRELLSDAARPSCKSLCKTGKPCRNPALIGEDFCYCHL